MSRPAYSLLISIQAYKQMLEDVKDKKAELLIKMGALDMNDPARVRAQNLLNLVDPQIDNIKALLDSKLAVFQRPYIFKLTNGLSDATDVELDRVKKRTDEIEQEKKLQELERVRDMMNAMAAHLKVHSRPVSPVTSVKSVSTFGAASVISEDHFPASSVPLVPLSPEHTSSSYFDNYNGGVPSAIHLAPAEASYISQPIADLSRFNDPNYRPSLSSNGAHSNLVEDEYSATMVIAHHRTFSDSSALPMRLDTPEPARPSLPVPPRRKPRLNPAFNFGTNSHPLTATEGPALRAERSSEPVFVRDSSRDAQGPEEDSICTNIDNVYELRSDTGGSHTRSYVDFSEVSSDDHDTHSNNLSIDTDAFGTHH